MTKFHIDLEQEMSFSGVATGGNGGVRTPTSVQTPLEISANPLKSFITYRGGGYPMYVYCNFYCSPAKKHGLDPPTFLGLATPLMSLNVLLISLTRNFTFGGRVGIHNSKTLAV